MKKHVAKIFLRAGGACCLFWRQPTIDIERSIDVGMKAVWVRNNNWGHPLDYDATIEGLHELLTAIDWITGFVE